MVRRFIPILVIVFFAACNNEQPDALLSAPPYASLTDSIARAPRNADLRWRRGQLLYQHEEFERAKTDLRAAWQLSPREDIALSLTTALRRQSDDSAFVFLQSARKHLPQSIALAVGLARAYQKKGQADAALEICGNILKIFPNQLDALLLKADLEQGAGRDADALRTLETAYAYAPSDVELVHRLDFAYAQAGDKKTVALSDSLIKADAEGVHAEPWYFKALYFENNGNNGEALRLLDEAVRRDYNFLDAHMEKGYIHFNQKQYDDALKAFNLVIRITPSYADAWYWIGKTQEAMGNKAEAKLNYQRAYGLDKNNKDAQAAAARL